MRPSHPNVTVATSIRDLFIEKYKNQEGASVLERMADMVWESMTDAHREFSVRKKSVSKDDADYSYINRKLRRSLVWTRSPIEAQFMCALMCVKDFSVCEVMARTITDLENATLAGRLDWPSIFFTTQLRIDRFRADFAMASVERGGMKRMVVECDGHNFHEKTKIQIAKDKARERRMTAHSFYIMRFSGHEIFKDPMKCAREALIFFYDTVQEDIGLRASQRRKKETQKSKRPPGNDILYEEFAKDQLCSSCDDPTGYLKSETHLHIHHNGEGPLCLECLFKKKTGMTVVHKKVYHRFAKSWRANREKTLRGCGE